MNDPRQPAGPGAPRPTLPQSPGGIPQAPRPLSRPAQAPHPLAAQHAAHTAPTRPAATQTIPQPADKDDDAIALIDDGEDADTLHKKIKAFGTETMQRAQQKWTRAPIRTGTGPARVRTFHAKLSDQGLEYLDDAINHFLDEHPEVDVKFVTSNVGMFDGKFKDLALVVNVWY